MSQSRIEKLKYALLKAVDLSGFKVVDPVVRLVFAEEPRKQIVDIVKYLVTPVLFVLLCFGLWSVIAPRHKTKSGEVPTPSQVWEALVINDTLNERENEKEADFLRSGEERSSTIAAIENQLQQKEFESEQLQENLLEIEKQAQRETAKLLLPHQKKLDELKDNLELAQKSREAEIATLALSISKGNSTKSELLDAIRADKAAQEFEKTIETELKEEMNDIRSSPPGFLKDAQQKSNAVATIRTIALPSTHAERILEVGQVTGFGYRQYASVTGPIRT